MSTHKLLLSAKNLCVDYSHHGLTIPIVQDFNLNIHEGETIAISGESGSGKSVSALSLMGLTGFYPGMSARGQVVIDGVNMLEENETAWANIRGKFISIVFQQALSALNPVLTIGNQLKEAIQIHQPDLSSQDIIIKAKALLNETGLTETDRMLRSYPHELSGGQLQRIVISMAIAHKPKIIIADEATSSLDEQTATEIIALLKRIQAKNGTALIIISHDFRQLIDVCDRLLIIHQGKVTDEISSDQIRSGNMTELSKAYILADQLLTKRNALGQGVDTLLKIENLSKSYKKSASAFWKKPNIIKALQNISFTVSSGEILGIMGPSGSGKSTIAKIISGLIDASDGQIIFEDRPLSKKDLEENKLLRKSIQMVAQDALSSMNPSMAIGEQWMEVLLFHKIAKSKTEACTIIDQKMKEFDLPEDTKSKYPVQLSGGQLQRAALMKNLLLNPKLVIFDESLSALDRPNQVRMINLIKDLQAKTQFSGIFISHDPLLIQSISHRYFTLENGMIITQNNS